MYKIQKLQLVPVPLPDKDYKECLATLAEILYQYFQAGPKPHVLVLHDHRKVKENRR